MEPYLFVSMKETPLFRYLGPIADISFPNFGRVADLPHRKDLFHLGIGVQPFHSEHIGDGEIILVPCGQQ